jgi:hypothetical protein
LSADSSKNIKVSVSQNESLNLLLWASILEDIKVSGVLRASSWVVWIYEELHLDQFHLVWVMPINLFYLLHLESKSIGGSCAQKEAKQRKI